MHTQAMLRLWRSRVLWFLVAASFTVMVAFAGAGIVLNPDATLSGTTGQRVVKAEEPRQPGDPYRIVPQEGGSADVPWHWSAKPWWNEVRAYTTSLFAGNLEYRVQQGRTFQSLPLMPEVTDAWWRSFRLLAVALLLGGIAGALIGALSLGSRVTRSIAMGVAVGGLSVPDFFLVAIGQMLTIWTYQQFDLQLWSVALTGDSIPWISLPSAALAIAPMSYIARLTATALDEVMREDYIRTARSKGLPEGKVILGHAFRNILPRVMDGLPAMINITLSSLVVVELLTAYNGLGMMLSKNLWGGPAAVAATTGLVFCAWFTVADGLAHTVRVLVSPFQREVGS